MHAANVLRQAGPTDNIRALGTTAQQQLFQNCSLNTWIATHNHDVGGSPPYKELLLMRLWRPLDTEAVETEALAAGEPEFF